MCQMKWGVLSINDVQCNRSKNERKCVSEKMSGKSGLGVEGDSCQAGDERSRQGASSSPVRERNVKES